MDRLQGLEPAEVFRFFEDICAIPHGSKNTVKISQYLVEFAKDRGLRYIQDDMGNVIIFKGGSRGYETAEPVILQGHMDMVAVKDADCQIDLANDGLDLEIIERETERWLTAKGTSLGGDDGIAVAYALAILDSGDISHPPIEAVFTVDEEIGMLGASALDTSPLKGKALINIDSEDEGIFTVSCAGGLTAKCTFKAAYEAFRGAAVELTLSGLTGGHSGVEIDKGRLNALIVLGRLLLRVREYDYRILTISGGDKDNAIPSSAKVSLVVPPEYAAALINEIKDELDIIKAEYSTVEKGIQLSVALGTEADYECMDLPSRDAIISYLINVPNGIQRMNPDMPGMVQTSLNLGIARNAAGLIEFSFSLRSSSESEKKHLLSRLTAFSELFGMDVSTSGDYPGWSYSPVSRLRDTFVNAYSELYGSKPIVESIHAGLECGIFASKLDGLDCISVGPQMTDIHTTNEALSISSVERTWRLLLKVLKEYK